MLETITTHCLDLFLKDRNVTKMWYNTQPPDGKYKTKFFIVLYSVLIHEFLDLQTCLVDKIVITTLLNLSNSP